MNIKQLLRKIVLKIRGEIGAVDADLQSAKRDISGLQSGLDLKADKSETYTKTETDSLLSSKADKSEVSEVDIDLEGTGTIVSIPENATGYGTIEKLGGKTRNTIMANNSVISNVSTGDTAILWSQPSELSNGIEYTISYWGTQGTNLVIKTSNYGIVVNIGYGESIKFTFTDNAYFWYIHTTSDLDTANWIWNVDVMNGVPSNYESNVGLNIYCPTNVKVVGRNLWDEQWEVGDIGNNNGINITSTRRFRSKNFVTVKPNKNYYFANLTPIFVYYYDNNKNYISYNESLIENKIITIPNNCYYIRFKTYNITTYNNDIAIIEGTSGTYSPYTEQNLPQTSIINYVSNQLQTNHSWTQENASKWLGLGVGNDSNIIDYANKKGNVKYGIVDMGTLQWQNATTYYQAVLSSAKDLANCLSTLNLPIFTSYQQWGNASSGIVIVNNGSYTLIRVKGLSSTPTGLLIYELAEPIEIDLSSLETEEHFECESGGSIIHDNIANYKYSFPVSLKGQVELNFEHDKEQQRDIDSLKKEIDLKANDSELSSVAKGLDKSLYNLGAFDTISGNVITRQTGYLYGKDLFSLNVADYGNITYYKIPKPTGALDYGIYSYNAITNKYPKYQGSNWNSTECIGKISGYAEASYYWVGFTKGTTLAQALADFQDLVLQYKLATPYTEEIIEGQPLITLDSQGSQWLRSEWEKGLNLLPNSESVSGATQTVITEVVNLPIGTYTIKVSGGTYSGAMALNVNYDDGTSGSNIVAGNVGEPLTFTTSKVITTISVYCNSTMSNVNFMLNEGTEPLPYQEYNGSIVREKQIEELKNEINSLKERIALLESK